jgi:hypothetical protein
MGWRRRLGARWSSSQGGKEEDGRCGLYLGRWHKRAMRRCEAKLGEARGARRSDCGARWRAQTVVAMAQPPELLLRLLRGEREREHERKESGRRQARSCHLKGVAGPVGTAHRRRWQDATRPPWPDVS